MGLCKTTVEGNGNTMDLSTLDKEALILEIMRQHEENLKLREQRDFLQAELLRRHRREKT